MKDLWPVMEMGDRQHFCSFRDISWIFRNLELERKWFIQQKNICSDIHGFYLCLLMSYVFVGGVSPWWFLKSGQDDPSALWRPMIFCVFLKLMEVLKIPSWERRVKGCSCVSVKFVVHVWVGWWLMVPKGIVQFIGWSLFQDSVFLTISLKVVIILVTVVRGRITLIPEFIWYMHLVWKDSPTQEYLVPVQSHSCIAA